MTIIDRNRPLKFETPTEGGTEIDYLPTEMSPQEDYADVKGVVFESVSGSRIEGVSGVHHYYDTENPQNVSGWTLTDLSQRIFGRQVANVDPVTGHVLIWGVSGWTPKFIDSQSSISASPGFTWGRSGAVPTNAWLLNDSVPSNITGRLVFLNNAIIKNVFVGSKNVETSYSIGVYSHTGNETNLTLLTTITVNNARGGAFSVSVSVTTGLYLALRVTAGSPQDVEAGLVLSGDFS